MTASGLLYWSTRAATVGLVVREVMRDGVRVPVVVDAPPYARGWALGADARVLWRRGVAAGVTLAWLPRA